MLWDKTILYNLSKETEEVFETRNTTDHWGTLLLHEHFPWEERFQTFNNFISHWRLPPPWLILLCVASDVFSSAAVRKCVEGRTDVTRNWRNVASWSHVLLGRICVIDVSSRVAIYGAVVTARGRGHHARPGQVGHVARAADARTSVFITTSA